MYRTKVIAWFNARFPISTKSEGIPCSSREKLAAAVRAAVDPDRRVTVVEVLQPSGHAVFDRLVEDTLAQLPGQKVPPPPPLYPDMARHDIHLRFTNDGVACPQPD
ncbi:MAG TPA: TonB C-terminal domain-containing protein [Polyangiaceae bacterium]|jgi:hypothetical protein|nr:TonB C-terminal domain-containing protein [Polyangiaceae bacterium]